ncbi:aromatic ring-hydroxylating dioxygenase subunit alpha [Dasania sp. GY-MA-18]|uniref:Aromatic ring-hydroxylating dioxygenase subunit alpha n=1 Tax=Dasania phycosphaerae TaxID=2950436 RepID=A0A9J6RJA2_9GAMM|nr:MULTISPECIES: aromatic ring-hydroxylating dioxygenase subunit alpha [Dasania]MCR8922346.1 aromatic ring-hydroxylating dioxygenase subunit alpha [Dasania sp. GY-MA-18]MCZ0864774.1 aromatic ring-hydroxylating dioxygenase subunit alpha [Dasania phycosphaerae]MCZ0868502.1 aromatic ring-hydroxylating dioxygenase subunit alpha [Dasania phycosphaerae]
MKNIITTSNSINLDGLIEEAESNPGKALAREFYSAEEVFSEDMQTIFKKQWVLVDHISRIPEKGQYFLFEIANESIIILRESEDKVNAFYNVCRHRGSKICLDNEGQSNFLLCPYHAWSYNLDGSLKAARTMPEDFDKSEHSLHSCHVKVFHGLIFINLSEGAAPDFDSEYAALSPFAEQQGIATAKIAVKKEYPNVANWKLVVENFIECYHCKPAHPEYCSVHPAEKLLAFGAGPGSGPEEAVEKYSKKLLAWEEAAQAMGHLTGVYDGGNDSLGLAQAARYPINDRGWLSETLDGKPACKKLMGNFKDYDGGQTALAFNPFSFALCCNDFAVILRWTPKDALNTNIELTWLVSEDAVEGVDYDPENLVKVWDITIKQDKQITENNQSGVMSGKYVPGPYSLQEARNISFKKWYLKQLKSSS